MLSRKIHKNVRGRRHIEDSKIGHGMRRAHDLVAQHACWERGIYIGYDIDESVNRTQGRKVFLQTEFK